MSNTIDVKFTADTASAVAEVDKLKAATHEQVTAGDLAGASMKELGKELQRVKANTIENTEATRKAKEATADLKLVQDKFGTSSKEAAAAQAKLTAAEKEAERTAAVLADTMKRVAVAVGEAGKQADGKLSPAAERATKQLASMSAQAERNAADMKRLELQGQKNAWSFDLAGVASSKLASILGPAALAGTVMGLASWIGEASAATLQYETALSNLPFALASAQDATHGLMSESALAVSASQALALGVVKTEAEFSQLASDAAKIALKLGTSTDQMLGDLTTALGRGSAMILDNAGIILKVSDANEAYAKSVGKTVEQLDEAEKKIAFQTAAMEAIRKSADQTTVAYDGNAAAVLRYKIAAGNAWAFIERGAVNGAGAVAASITNFRAEIEQTAAAADLMNREMMRAQGWSQGFKDMAASAGLAAIELGGMGDVVAHFGNVLSDPANLQKGIDAERQKAELLTEEAKQAERVSKAMTKIAADNEAFLQAQTEASLFIGPMPAPKEEKKKRGSKKADREMVSPGDVAIARIFDGRELGDSVSVEAAWTQVQIEEDAAQALYDVKMAAFERELELLEARGEADTEAQAARESLLARRQELEEDHAKEQFRMAREDTKREQALTKMEALEQKRRVAALRKAADEEAAERAKQIASMEKVTSLVGDLGNTLVEGLWAAAEGAEGAGAQILSNYLKNTAKQQAIEALVQTAKGTAMLAGVYTAPLAPPYFLAAAKHAGVAIAAGGAAIGLNAGGGGGGAGSGAPRPDAGAKTERERERDDAKSNFEWDGSAWRPEDRTRQPGGGNPERQSLSAHDVPLSYDSSKNPVAATAAQSNVYNITFQGGMWASGGPEKAAQEIKRLLRTQGAAGNR